MRIIKVIAIAITVMASACTSNNSESIQNQKKENMDSYIAIFEIPATDINRAINFYEKILHLKIEKMEFPGMEMGLLPFENQMVTGVICKGDDYVPSSGGVTVYINAGNDLQIVLNKIESHGGQVIIPKTPHADESGYFAIFIDSEGNKMGLHSPN